MDHNRFNVHHSSLQGGCFLADDKERNRQLCQVNISKDTGEVDQVSCSCDWHPFPSKLTSDIAIRVADSTFHAQRDILSYFSPVLKDFLEKTDSSKITLKNISPEAMEILLHYMYTADLKINCQNIVEIYRSSQKLRIKEITFKCIQIMRSENTTGYLYKYTASMQLGLFKEMFKSYKVILWNLEEYIENKELLDLHPAQICEILTGAGMSCVKTNIKSYYTLFLLALQWLNHKEPERTKHVVVVMCSVPFHRMSKEEILQCLFPKSATPIVEVPGVKRIILSSLSKSSVKEFLNKD